jgi:N-acetylglucosamine-6-phosphate deacetylase
MKAYVNGQIFDGQKTHRHHAVLTEKGKVLGIVAENAVPAQAQICDLQNHLLAPALLDLQIYGGNGHLFGEHPSVSALEATYAYSQSGGAHHFLPTVATHSEAVVGAAIEAVRDYWARGGKGVLGLHLEGPFINPVKRGAHLPEYIQTMSRASVEKLLAIGKGIIKMMTLAPECCDTEGVHLLQKNGVIISAGHTNARYDQAQTAFKNGIHLATHLFNAMSPLGHRETGMVGAILDNPKVYVSLVADGYHVDWSAIRIAKQVKKSKLFLITDAVTTNSAGKYLHQLNENRYVMPDGTLSGSALTMIQAVKNCIAYAQIPREEALRMASRYPAHVIGLGKRLGRIAVGYEADFILLDEQMNLVAGIL